MFRIVFHPGFRSEWQLANAKPSYLFQPYRRTSFDRHPAIFSFVRDALADDGTLRILSYGCSTGEEVFTLRKYFPMAEIAGIDINPRSIAACRRKQTRSGDARLRFIHAATPHGEPAAAYDAVFCLSVLRHGELGARQPASSGHLIRFSDFEEIVQALCRCLKPGGYLTIVGSNFRFADTVAATDFEAVYRMGGDTPRGDTPLYGPDNRRLADGVYNDVIFRKKETGRKI
ncbi:MAG TPA: class I SAM-dependent methyltransferase [Gallionella sp.]|nr:class I SAM-dependent methyltransferase [Gallionella sp.]